MPFLALPKPNNRKVWHKPRSFAAGVQFSDHPLCDGLLLSFPFIPARDNLRPMIRHPDGLAANSWTQPVWRYNNGTFPGTTGNRFGSGLDWTSGTGGNDTDLITPAGGCNWNDFTEDGGGSGMTFHIVWSMPLNNGAAIAVAGRKFSAPVSYVGKNSSGSGGAWLNGLGVSIAHTAKNTTAQAGLYSCVFTSNMGTAGNVTATTVVYHNGTLDTDDQTTGQTLDSGLDINATLFLGSSQSASSLNLADHLGMMHDFKIYNRDLSRDEARQLAESPYITYQPISTRVYSFPSAAAVSTPGVQIFITK